MKTGATKSNEADIGTYRFANYFIGSLSISLLTWMYFGERISKPLCDLSIFEQRRDSCYRNGALEIRDRLSIIVLALLIFIFLLLSYYKNLKNLTYKDSKTNLFFDWMSITSITLAISLKDYYPSFTDRSGNEFSGLGPSVSLLAVVISLSITVANSNQLFWNAIKKTFLQNSKIFSLAAGAIVFIFYVPVLIQFGSSFASPVDASYVRNELLAPVAGILPLSTSMPQYNSLLGWPLVIVTKVFGKQSVFFSAEIWLMFLTASIIISLVFILVNTFPKISKMVGLLGVCSLLLGKSSDSLSPLTLAAFPSATVRLILPTLVGVILQFLLKSKIFKFQIYYSLILGALSIFSLINNIEFGTPACLTCATIIILFALLNRLSWQLVLTYFAGLLTPLIVIGLLLNSGKQGIQFDYWYLIAKEFGGRGFMSWPMPLFGTYFIVYTVSGLAIIFSIKGLILDKNSSRSNKYFGNSADFGIALYGGFWTLSTLVFYSARSVDGNLRVIFIPTLIAAIGLYKLILTTCYKSDPKFNLTKNLPHKFKETAKLPLLLIAVIPVAMLIKLPDPTANLTRISHTPDEATWSWTSTEKREITQAYFHLAKRVDGRIGIMADDANSISVVTGAVNLLAVNSQADLTISSKLRERACDRLLFAEVDFVLIEGRFTSDQLAPCPSMVEPKVVGQGLTLFVLDKTN